jgi:aspartate/methionine/tyrosine aminotransferase
MGVIRVNNEAGKVGYRMGDPEWCNLGQGQPEVGEMAGAPARYSKIEIAPGDHAYGPVEGVPELREAIAAHYNRLYRRGKSQYSADNVAVAAGGRLALTRIGAALEKVRLGYFTPDYTAYEDMMVTFHRLEPVWIELRAETGFRIAPAELEKRVEREKIGALLISNPCNPTGVVVEGEDLKAWVAMSRRRGCTLLMDEFYSHYRFTESGGPAAGPVSAAEFVEDVDSDAVVIVDGLTKCFRYPGWRVGWVVAPKKIIQALTAAGSFADGGPPRPMQRAACAVLEAGRADQETSAVRNEFAAKMKLTVEGLVKAGVKFPARPRGTFYAWGDISGLPGGLNDGVAFMHEAFKHKVLTVPGEFFDVNPGRVRTGKSPLAGFVRFSFGPPREVVERGVRRIGEMVAGKR